MDALWLRLDLWLLLSTESKGLAWPALCLSRDQNFALYRLFGLIAVGSNMLWRAGVLTLASLLLMACSIRLPASSFAAFKAAPAEETGSIKTRAKAQR
jgi:hypothetical protein